MRNGRLPSFVTGLLLGGAISLFVLLAWPFLYAESLWPGYRQAPVNQAHEYNSSPASRNHVLLVFVITGGAVGLTTKDLRNVVFAWLGLSAALLVSFALRPAAWSSNLAPLAIILYPVQASLFLLAGLGGRLATDLLRPHAA